MTIKIVKKVSAKAGAEKNYNATDAQCDSEHDTAGEQLPGKILSFPIGSVETSPKLGSDYLTEDGVAEEFALRYGKNLRFDHGVSKWFFFVKTHWEMNVTHLAFDYARHLCRELRQGESRMASKKAAEGVEHMARRDKRLAVTSDIWDQDTMLLGTPGGVVDLRKGKLRDASPNDYISKITSTAPASKGTPCPIFMGFLKEVTGNDAGLQRLLQQFAGYSLTGEIKEQVLMFIFGPGGNGKSLLQNVLIEILGDYGRPAAMETFAQSRQARHLTEIAMLRGARFVGVSETERGQAWSEARINQLTGGDLVTANFMRQDHFTFRPQFKLLIVGNYKPHLGAVNDAAKRRFIIVPFLFKPKEPDRTLPAKLRDEFPAILRWMIDGCLDWQAHGLVIPDVVHQATADYFDEQDLLGRWIAEKCDCGAGLKAKSSALYTSWKEFATENGEHPGSSKAFAPMLINRGFGKAKSSEAYYLGLQLKSITTLNFQADL